MRAILLTSLLLVACPKTGMVPQHAQDTASNLHLRKDPDTDGSDYIGRFFDWDAESLDETLATKLACSKHITWKQKDGGGVTHNEVVNVSSQMAASMGIPLAVNAKGQASYNATVKVQYILTGKLVAQIEDPAAFSQCCQDQPKGCTDRYVGEMLQGTGSAYVETATNAMVKARGFSGPARGDLDGSHSKSKELAMEFPNPVYFAFKVTRAQAHRTGCGDWEANLPKKKGGRYYVGTSRPQKDKKQGRHDAEQNAMWQAYQSAGGDNHEDASKATAYNKPNPLVAWAQGMEIEQVCPEPVSRRKNAKMSFRVLGFLPDYVTERQKSELRKKKKEEERRKKQQP